MGHDWVLEWRDNLFLIPEADSIVFLDRLLGHYTLGLNRRWPVTQVALVTQNPWALSSQHSLQGQRGGKIKTYGLLVRKNWTNRVANMGH